VEAADALDQWFYVHHLVRAGTHRRCATLPARVLDGAALPALRWPARLRRGVQPVPRLRLFELLDL